MWNLFPDCRACSLGAKSYQDEGSIMLSRLQKKEEPRDLAVRHLEEYLESRVRAPKSRGSIA
jgi:hypothetical protein